MKRVLSYGLGADSSGIAAHWCLNPDSRDFDLEEDLIVVTANTGNEYASTRQLVETHIFPLFREHNVRFVELGRAGPRTSDGIVVLTDTRQPYKLHPAGPWTITDEYDVSGSVVQQSNRRCSQRFKGEVIDAWVRAELGDEPYRHAIGFAVGEENRAQRDAKCYGGGAGRDPWYPLQDDWHWTRADVQAYLAQVFGTPFLKSACVRCPFACSSESEPVTAGRWADEPEAAATVVVGEYRALAFNRRAAVFGSRALKSGELRSNTAASFVERHGLYQVRAIADDMLAAMPWDVVHVRRLVIPADDGKPTFWRSLTITATAPDRGTADEHLRWYAAQHAVAPSADENGSARVWLRQPDEAQAVQATEFYTIAPTGAAAKERPRFAPLWAAHVLHDQLPWDVVRVRRLTLPSAAGKTVTWRDHTVVATAPDQQIATDHLAWLAARDGADVDQVDDRPIQAWLRRPDDDEPAQASEYYTVALSGAPARHRPKFTRLWAQYVLHPPTALFPLTAAAA